MSAASRAQWRGDGARPLKDGPWGELASLPISIAAPADLLPVRAMESATTQWYFKGYSREELTTFFGTLGLSDNDRSAWLSDAVMRVLPGGIVLTPPHKLSPDLPPAARLAICAVLSRAPENGSALFYFHSSVIDAHLHDAEVSPDTVNLFKSASAPYGEYRVLPDLPSVLSAIPTYEEKARLFKGLTYQNTLLLRLHITPQSDINALTAYWGKAFPASNVRAIFESLSHVSEGAWIDVVELLPPGPAGRLNSFPMPDNPIKGPAVRRDCHWTSFNFFRDVPDSAVMDGNYIRQKLGDDYYPITGDARYGDVIVLTAPDGTVIHSAVFIADDIVYTKNGDTPIHPWMLSTLPELIKQYAFHAAPGQHITLNYFRNKNY